MDKIEVSHKTIIFTIFLLIFLWILYQIRHIVFLLYISLIFTTAVSPVVAKLEKVKIPRGIAVLLLYLLFIGGLSLTIASIVPVLVKQTSELLGDLPDYLDKIGFEKLQIGPKDYADQLAKVPGSVFKIITATFSNILKVFAFLVINFYLLLERKNLKKHLRYFFAEEKQKKVERFVLDLEKKLGGWVRGEIILMFLVGLMSYLGLRLLDLDFALPLALIAGFLELIPNIGPTVSAIPAIIVGFASSPVIGLAVLALCILIQQLENNLITPKIIQHTVGLHPLVTLVALMIGLALGGIAGTLLAVPTLIFIRVLLAHFYFSSRQKTNKFNGFK
jgi:predicted PurR-regulated permease PerM